MRRDAPFAQLVVPDHRELDRGTLRAIIRQAGLSVDEFVALVQLVEAPGKLHKGNRRDDNTDEGGARGLGWGEAGGGLVAGRGGSCRGLGCGLGLGMVEGQAR